MPLDGVNTIAGDGNIGGVFNGLDIDFPVEFWNGVDESGDGFADEIKKGIAYLQARLPNGPARDDGGDYHFFYGNYYATQAMFMSGGDAWKAYWPPIRGQPLKRQQTNGSWSGDSGTVYATSMALIILQVPNRLLPILQK